MRFTINTDEVKQRGIPAEVFLSVLPLYFGLEVSSKTLEEANHLGFNQKTDDGHYIISIEGRNLLDSVFMCSDYTTNKTHDEYMEIARALTHLYPKGIKPNTNKMWRGSLEDISDRLRVLEKKANIEISLEEAIKATQDYISSFEGDLTFMQILPYFVFKGTIDDDGDALWSSNLLSTIENNREDGNKN